MCLPNVPNALSPFTALVLLKGLSSENDMGVILKKKVC